MMNYTLQKFTFLSILLPMAFRGMSHPTAGVAPSPGVFAVFDTYTNERMKRLVMPEVDIYTDGGCLGNPSFKRDWLLPNSYHRLD
jgi:hypothetical protein